MIKENDYSLHICIDYRLLKSVSKIVYPVLTPNADDLLSQMAETKFFSKFDLTKGNYQFHMKVNSKQYTAFATSDGLLHFRMLSFGLSNNLSTFVRLMRIICGYYKNVGHYYDDIFFSSSFDEHLTDLVSVLDSLKQ